MIRKFLRKYGSSALALALLTVASQVATRGCFYVVYQPKEPAGLKRYSKN